MPESSGGGGVEANQKAAKPSLAFQLGLSLGYKQFHSWCGEVEVVALLRDRASLRSVGMPGAYPGFHRVRWEVMQGFATTGCRQLNLMCLSWALGEVCEKDYASLIQFFGGVESMGRLILPS